MNKVNSFLSRLQRLDVFIAIIVEGMLPFSFVYEVESLLKETVILGTNDKANFECQGNEQQQNANAHTGGTVKIPGLWLTQMYALKALFSVAVCLRCRSKSLSWH